MAQAERERAASTPRTRDPVLALHAGGLYEPPDRPSGRPQLPTPDPAEDWTHDPNTGLLRSPVTESLRTTKEPTVLVKYEATDKHPAQTETYMKDVPAGYWRQVLYSGAVQADRKNAILARVKKLQDAVKLAREQANLTDVERQKAGEALLAFLFAK